MALPSVSYLSRLTHSHLRCSRELQLHTKRCAMTETRSIVKLIRYTPSEHQAVANHARACGLPFARYVRETSLGAIPRIKRTNANAELIRQLSHIGNNLNQLARIANTANELPARSLLTDAIHAVLNCIRKLD